MNQKVENPLAKHFRQPAIYIKLPSKGKYWPEGSLDLSVTGEIPVYPMTARDEITIRTPDALMNGQGTIDVIQSCCPSIVNAWQMPSVDIDSILLSIRIASYGNSLDVDSVCPNCREESSFSVDISSLLSQIKMPDYESPLEVDGLQIKLRPLPYHEANRVNQIKFTEQQILRVIENDNLSEDEKKAKTDLFLRKLAELSIDICASSTQSITTEDGILVVESKFIKEFYSLTKFSVIKQVQNRLNELATIANLRPLDTKCSHCDHEYQMPLDFDYSNFFA
jgi:T4 bacteriophage base plate protein